MASERKSTLQGKVSSKPERLSRGGVRVRVRVNPNLTLTLTLRLSRGGVLEKWRKLTPTHQLQDLGSAVRSHSGVQGKAPVAKSYDEF